MSDVLKTALEHSHKWPQVQPLPLSIQGLIEMLPRDGRWTREKAEQWLELARLTFAVVYDLDAP